MTEFLAPVLAATAALAAPLLAAALGELLAERAGVLNIGLEGMMLGGAFAGFLAAYRTGSPELGLAAGALAGAALAFVFGAAALGFQGDQIVTGAALNVLAAGATGVAYRASFGVTGAALTVPTLPPLAIPGLANLPVVGDALFRENAFVYGAFLLVPLVWWALERTRWGLGVRAAGEHPRAADASGIDVAAARWSCVLAGGALAGASGAYLSVGHANTFVEGMTAGRGFMALAVVILGKWRPWGALGGALLFGLAGALRFRFGASGSDLPYHFFLALPYLATLAALALFVGRARAPAALAQPYARE